MRSLPPISMRIALMILWAWAYCSPAGSQPPNGFALPPAEPPLAGKNSVSGLHVERDSGGAWIAQFDYFYTGDPTNASLHLKLVPLIAPQDDPVALGKLDKVLPQPQRGAHHVSEEIGYPGEQRTIGVEANISVGWPNATVVVARQGAEKVIDWPTFQTWMNKRLLVQMPPEQNLQRAIALIDTEDEARLAEAKTLLETLVSQNPQFDAAYVELARIALRTNTDEQGQHEAENLLASALQIHPDNVDAKILLGGVYVNQKRFAKAEALFEDAAKSKPSNQWLWTNWGDLLRIQGKDDEAISKYREVISQPRTYDSHGRARLIAYRNLLYVLDSRKDLDGMEALYKQRLAEYGPGSCYSADYALFELQQRGNTQAAIDLARGALDKDCEDSESRKVLGLAEYVQWAAAEPGPKRAESLNQARIFLPTGPMPLYLLAASDRTVGAAKQLIASGEAIDQKDNEKLTALAYALKDQDLAAARRLLVLGSRPNEPVGYEGMPVALLPVVQGSVESIRLLKQFGADYSALRYQGATAFDLARLSGNNAVLQALGEEKTKL